MNLGSHGSSRAPGRARRAAARSARRANARSGGRSRLRAISQSRRCSRLTGTGRRGSDPCVGPDLRDTADRVRQPREVPERREVGRGPAVPEAIARAATTKRRNSICQLHASPLALGRVEHASRGASRPPRRGGEGRETPQAARREERPRGRRRRRWRGRVERGLTRGDDGRSVGGGDADASRRLAASRERLEGQLPSRAAERSRRRRPTARGAAAKVPNAWRTEMPPGPSTPKNRRRGPVQVASIVTEPSY